MLLFCAIAHTIHVLLAHMYLTGSCSDVLSLDVGAVLCVSAVSASQSGHLRLTVLSTKPFSCCYHPIPPTLLSTPTQCLRPGMLTPSHRRRPACILNCVCWCRQCKCLPFLSEEEHTVAAAKDASNTATHLLWTQLRARGLPFEAVA